jgi:nitrate reductase gamma subunit
VSDELLFVVAPYVAAVSLAAGTLAGLLRRSNLAFLVFRRARTFAIGLAGVLTTHLVLVAWPGAITAWSRTFERLLLLEAVLFLLGVTALVGLSIFLLGPRRHWPQPMAVVDAILAGVLVVTIVSGLAVAVFHRWPAAWASVTVVPYVRSVANLHPDLRYLESMPYLVKLHLFSSLVVLALAPFTRPARQALSAANRMAVRLLMPIAEPLGRTRARCQDWMRRGPATLMWPEEDEYE